MFRHVLVPLDGSTVAEQALEYAKQVVTKDGRISLLTVIDLPARPSTPASRSRMSIRLSATPTYRTRKNTWPVW